MSWKPSNRQNAKAIVLCPWESDRRKVRGRRHGELPSDLCHKHRTDLAGGSWKPSPIAEERQQHCEPEPVAVVLGHDESQIRERQHRSLQGKGFLNGYQIWTRVGCRGGRP
jgi:hypothetical protein